MPYWITPKEFIPACCWGCVVSGVDGLQADVAGPYPTRKEAATNPAFAPKTHEVRYASSDEERSAWYWRLNQACLASTFIKCPVPAFLYWKDPIVQYHNPHVSLDKPNLVGFYASEEHLYLDRVTWMAPGRYISTYYTASKDQIDCFVESVKVLSAGTGGYTLATSEEDIIKVYMHGPPSCMDGQHVLRYIKTTKHPVAVYAAPSDLAVAYYGPLDKAIQRTVVWPEKRRWSRIYGTGPLQALLARDGWVQGSMEGARIRCIEDKHGYLMPYIDGVEFAHLPKSDPRFFVLGFNSRAVLNVGTQATSGYVCGADEPENTCRHCGRHIGPDDDLCAHCDDDLRWYCGQCEHEYLDGAGGYLVRGVRVCDLCYERGMVQCADADCTQRFHPQGDFTLAEEQYRETHGMADLCRACQAHYAYCEDCQRAFDTPVCPDCGRVPRCEHTPDLLAHIPALSVRGETVEVSNECPF